MSLFRSYLDWRFIQGILSLRVAESDDISGNYRQAATNARSDNNSISSMLCPSCFLQCSRSFSFVRHILPLPERRAMTYHKAGGD